MDLFIQESKSFHVIQDTWYQEEMSFCIANSGDSPEIMSDNSECTILYALNGSCVTDCKEVATNMVLILSPNEKCYSPKRIVFIELRDV